MQGGWEDGWVGGQEGGRVGGRDVFLWLDGWMGFNGREFLGILPAAF